MTNTGHVAISRSGVITADILLSERCLKPCARVLHHHGKPFDAASIGSAAFILLPTLAIMGRPTRRHGRQGRRPATVQQGGLLTVLAGAVPGAGGDGTGVVALANTYFNFVEPTLPKLLVCKNFKAARAAFFDAILRQSVETVPDGALKAA